MQVAGIIIKYAGVAEWQTHRTQNAAVYPCRFKSGHRHQTGMIRIKFSPWRVGSDCLFSLKILKEACVGTKSGFSPIDTHNSIAEHNHRQRVRPLYCAICNASRKCPRHSRQFHRTALEQSYHSNGGSFPKFSGHPQNRSPCARPPAHDGRTTPHRLLKPYGQMNSPGRARAEGRNGCTLRQWHGARHTLRG